MKLMATAPDVNGAQRRSAGFDPDALRAGMWKLPAAANSRARGRGWADPGERVALKYVAVEARCRPILDIGVGTGRTTELLRAISRDYVGIDDTPEMVEMCRARNPEARISLMHPRDLGGFEANRFALVVFSFNGIDASSLTERRTILREVHRVLQPNGLFVMSAHNRDGTPPGELPRVDTRFSGASMQQGRSAWWRVRSLPDSLRDYVRRRVLSGPGGERAVRHRPADRTAAHSSYTTPAEQKLQLREAGLQTEVVLDNLAGRPVADDANTSAFSWLHYIARKL